MAEKKDTFKPYVNTSVSLPEFTFRAVAVGALLGGLFAAANVYLGMKAGLTISASIPVAVMAAAIFRAMKNKKNNVSSILESNISQTVGASGEALASGVIFTLPALILWGLSPSWLEMTIIAMFGGFIGVLFMIPLRRFLIKEEHDNLPYPEGTACAEVLKAADKGGADAKYVFAGVGTGAIYKFFMSGLGSWIDIPEFGFKRLRVGIDLSPALLGVGYILGMRISAVMVSGGFLSAVILIPLVAYYGGNFPGIFPTGGVPMESISTNEIWRNYIRYIGAGGVAFGGIITLIRAIPTIVRSIKIASEQFVSALKKRGVKVDRTDRDIPLIPVVLGAITIVFLLALIPFLPLNMIGAMLIIIFGFFFVTVSSRITGMIGSSSNPVSGMTLTTLLATGVVFSSMGMTGMEGRAAVLMVGAIVCIAAAIGGDTSQDLKTGFLLGATPYKQQWGQIFGAVTAAGVVSLVVLALAGKIGSTELPAPQANLMKIVVEGALDRNLPWGLILIGMGIGAIVEMFKIPSLPFAVGLYLPISTTLPVFIGGLIRNATHEGKGENQPGVLFGSGLIAGDALIGIAIAILLGFVFSEPMELRNMIPVLKYVLSSPVFGLFVFGLVAWKLNTIGKSKA